MAARDVTQRPYDELLVILTLEGDRAASERLAARWYPRLLRTARRLMGEADLAEDMVQETWLRVARGLPHLRDPARFPAWIFSILHRTCADAIKRKTRVRARDKAMADLALLPCACSGPPLSELDQAFAQLTPDHRIAAILFFGEGLTLAEIATATGVPLGTAKSRIFHARRRLKAVLNGDEHDGF